MILPKKIPTPHKTAKVLNVFTIPTEEIKVFCEEFPKAIEALRK